MRYRLARAAPPAAPPAAPDCTPQRQHPMQSNPQPSDLGELGTTNIWFQR